MHFAQFVGQAGVEQNTFGSGGFARVDVGGNTDVAVTGNTGFYEPFFYPLDIRNGSERTLCWLLPCGVLLRVFSLRRRGLRLRQSIRQQGANP